MNTSTSPSTPQRVELPDLAGRQPSPNAPAAMEAHLGLIRSVKVRLTAHLGGAQITVGELQALKDGSIVALDRLADEPVDLLLEGQLVARGHLVAVDDNFGVRITEIAAPARP